MVLAKIKTKTKTGIELIEKVTKRESCITKGKINYYYSVEAPILCYINSYSISEDEANEIIEKMKK